MFSYIYSNTKGASNSFIDKNLLFVNKFFNIPFLIQQPKEFFLFIGKVSVYT